MDGVRIAIVLGALLVAAASATSNPPPQAMPPSQPAYGSTTAPTASTQYGSCDAACGQVVRCQIAPYDACLAECRRSGDEQQPAGRERLDTIARSSCEQLAQMGSQPTPSPPATEPSPPPAPAPPAPSTLGARWSSPGHVSYTNPAMVSADFYLEVTVAGDGSFQGAWARYACIAGAYGIMSCGKGQLEGRVSGRLDANGSGSIDLERLGRSALSWSQKSTSELVLELPRNWQGQNILFRSTLKR